MQENNLGALCVLDKHAKSLSAEKIELLKIIGDEIINRLKVSRHMEALRNRVVEVQETQDKVMHDIRGPIAGIIGLAEFMSSQGKENDLDEVLELIGMIYKGGKSVLELADEILTETKKAKANGGGMTLHTFKQRLEQLYLPQAKSKEIDFRVEVVHTADEVSFPQNKMMQIAGNLISNAIKFTPRSGSVVTLLDLTKNETGHTLSITVKDTGEGIEAEQIKQLLADNTASTDGTDGEKGYGFGLALVKQLVKGLKGTFDIV